MAAASASTTAAARVTVVGAGMSGAACARELAAAGLDVRLVERGRAPGGRMASPEVHGRRVDLGAAYFTAKDDDFVELVREWTERGLAREWTDTFTAISADGRKTTSGPMRYGTPGGLRSLVRDLLPDSVPIAYGHEIESPQDVAADAVVLAMPDPQARRLLPDVGMDVDWVDFDPVISVAAGYDTPGWTAFDAAFVNDDDTITFIADDGARRGDGAAVLVAHSTSELARRHLDDPQGPAAHIARVAQKKVGLLNAHEWIRAQRWTFAKPATTHDEPFGLLTHSGRVLGLCNDAWCPTGAPRVESAWLSGRELGRELARRLG